MVTLQLVDYVMVRLTCELKLAYNSTKQKMAG